MALALVSNYLILDVTTAVNGAYQSEQTDDISMKFFLDEIFSVHV